MAIDLLAEKSSGQPVDLLANTQPQSNVVQQIQSGAQESPILNTIGKLVAAGINKVNPNFPSGEEYGQASKDIQATSPAPQGVLQTIARGAGKYGPDVAASLPVFGAASALTKSPMLAAGIAGATYEGGKKVLEGENAFPTALESSVAGAATAGLLQGSGKMLEGVPSIMNKVKNVLSAGKNLKRVQSEIAKIAGLSPETKIVANEAKELVRYNKKLSLSELTDNFSKTNKTLNEQLKNETTLQSSANKEKLTSVFKNMSKTYRKGIDQAEDSLIAQGKSVTDKDYVTKVVDKTMQELKDRFIPEDSPAFQTLKEMQTSLKYPIDRKVEQMSLSDVKNLKNQIYDTLSSGEQSGTKYSGIDGQVANIFLKNHGNFIGELSPELKQLNAEFAPMANARNWAMKNFRPYNVNEIQKGANVLENIATGKTPNQTNINYLKQLEEGSGSFTGAGELKGKTVTIGKNIKNIKETFDLAKKNLIDSTDYKIHQLSSLGGKESELQNLIKTRNRIALLGAGLIGLNMTGLASKAARMMAGFSGNN